MKTNFFKPLLCVILPTAMATTAHAAVVDLDFSNVDGESSPPPTTIATPIIQFLDVATFGSTTVDARVTATVTGYEFKQHMPAYEQGSSDEPNGDLGSIFTVTSAQNLTGTMTYQIEFFDGTTHDFLTPFTWDEVDLVVYDVDGETYQSEAVRTFLSDGLFSYQVGDSSTSLIPSLENNNTEVLFSGRRVNVPENSEEGAVVLTYKNTNSITLRFESVTDAQWIDPDVFSAIDGDGSLFENSSFIPPVIVVPEPSSSFPLASLLVATLLGWRRRQG